MLAVTPAQSFLLCLLAEPQAAAVQWEAMLDSLDALSPLVDDVACGHAYVDMRGLPGDAHAWIAQCRALLAPYGAPVRVGAGANKFTAYAAARTSDGAICARGAERGFLAPLPIALLNLDERLAERLRMLGVTTLGELASLPHGPFVRRFGRAAVRWHDCARGEDPTPFVPRAHAIAIEASIFGEGRVEEEAQLFFALRIVLARVCADLERCGKRAGALELALELEDGSERSIAVPVASPTADEKTLGEVVRAKLTASTFPCAIVGVRLRAAQLEAGGEPMPIFPADDVDPSRVAVTLARLEAVTGEAPQRARIKAAHVLERRFAYEPFSLLPARPQQSAAGEGPAPALVPQLRLLRVREIVVKVERGAPAIVDGRRVIACRGPWRIEEGWFSDSAVTRDEYDVFLEENALVRIYRQGAHWYVRGAYD